MTPLHNETTKRLNEEAARVNARSVVIDELASMEPQKAASFLIWLIEQAEASPINGSSAEFEWYEFRRHLLSNLIRRQGAQSDAGNALAVLRHTERDLLAGYTARMLRESSGERTALTHRASQKFTERTEHERKEAWGDTFGQVGSQMSQSDGYDDD